MVGMRSRASGVARPKRTKAGNKHRTVSKRAMPDAQERIPTMPRARITPRRAGARKRFRGHEANSDESSELSTARRLH